MIRVADSSDCSICKACRRLPTRYTFSHPPSMPNAMTIPRSFTPHPNPQNAAKRHHHSSPTSASTPHKVPSNTSPPPAISQPPPNTPPPQPLCQAPRATIHPYCRPKASLSPTNFSATTSHKSIRSSSPFSSASNAVPSYVWMRMFILGSEGWGIE